MERANNVDETGLDETRLDETGLDEAALESARDPSPIPSPAPGRTRDHEATPVPIGAADKPLYRNMNGITPSQPDCPCADSPCADSPCGHPGVDNPQGDLRATSGYEPEGNLPHCAIVRSHTASLTT